MKNYEEILVHPLDDPDRVIENWHEYHKSEEFLRWKAQTEKEINEWLGFEVYRRLMAGFNVGAIVFERQANSKLAYVDEKTGETRQSILDAPEEVTKDDKWMRPVGRVIHIGPEAYTTGRWEDGTLAPRCKLGDYVFFGRHDGTMIKYRNKPLMVIADDRIGGCIDDANVISKY